MSIAFKPIEFIPAGTKLHFVRYFKPFFALSLAAIIGSIALLATIGLNFGIDFRGGTLIEIKTLKGDADLPALRSTLGGLGLGEVQIQTFGAPDDVMIRISEQAGGEKAQLEAVAKVREALGKDIEVRRVEIVGSIVSKELIEQAVLALVLASLGIFVYVWLRFEWQFALGSIVALVHDVLITIGVFALLQLDFNLTIVAALLTILGYSVNDTVVIYDRIRENLRKYKKMPLAELLDLSVNETLSRTVMTAGSTFVALLALYLFGGEVIRGFTFAMLFGVVIGTYSSVFIAAPLLMLIGVKRDWSGVGTAVARKPAASATFVEPDWKRREANGPDNDQAEAEESEPAKSQPLPQPLPPKVAAVKAQAVARAAKSASGAQSPGGSAKAKGGGPQRSRKRGKR
jgi:preprotein translocase subunit SecF